MKKSLFTIIIALFALMLAGFAFGEGSIHYEAADSSPAIRFQNIGSEPVSITIASGGESAANTVVIGSTTNTIDGSGAIDTVAELAAAIAAATNSAGNPVLIMDTRCSLSTDSTDGELLDGTYTAAAASGNSKPWGEILWDTSDVAFYSVYVPASRQSVTGKRTALDIDTLYGNPLGTGAVTASVYIGGTKAWEMLLPEVYAYSNNTASVALPVKVDIPAGNDSVLVRVSRATTATTGIIGVKMVESVNPKY